MFVLSNNEIAIGGGLNPSSLKTNSSGEMNIIRNPIIRQQHFLIIFELFLFGDFLIRLVASCYRRWRLLFGFQIFQID